MNSVSGNRFETKSNRRDTDVPEFSQLSHVLANAHSSQGESHLKFFDDNEPVNKVRVSRTHRVAIDWLFDRINMDPRTQIKCVDTMNQLADILTKRSFPREEWNHLLHLLNIMDWSMFSCTHFFLWTRQQTVQSAMSKRRQEASSEASSSPTAKPKPRSLNLVMAKPTSLFH